MKKIDGRSKAARASKASMQALNEINAAVEALTEDRGKVIQGVHGKYKAMTFYTPGKTVLQEAHELIYGSREDEYGHPRVNLENIAEQWSLYVRQKYRYALEDTGLLLDAEDVCWMMAQLKMCREYGQQKRDSIADAAGYIGLIERIRED